jgi:hypothetical protein
MPNNELENWGASEDDRSDSDGWLVTRPDRYPGAAEGAFIIIAERLSEPVARLIAEAPAMAEVLRELVDDPTACARRGGESAPVRGCDCWSCERTNKARAILSRIDGE